MPAQASGSAGWRRIRIVLAIYGVLVFFETPIAAELIVVGGPQGLSWQSGGGTIPASVIRTSRSVERTNTPGSVIDFDPEARTNWIFPQRADTSRNIAVGATAENRGGSIRSLNNPGVRSQLPNLIDDNGLTALDLRPTASGQSIGALGLLIDLDLGAPFGVNRFKFFPRNADPAFPAPDFPFQNDFMRAFEIFVNDGSAQNQREGMPILETSVLVGQNEEAVVDIRIPPQYIRFIRLKSLTATGFEIAEFQVFGIGFVPEAVYLSNIFDFGDLALLGNLRWSQDALGDPDRASAWIRTRTGRDPQPVEFNKIRPGERIFGTSDIEVPWKRAADVEDEDLADLIESVLDNESVDVRQAMGVFAELSLARQELITLDAADYAKLKREAKGGIRDDVVNWSGWSPPYPATGIVATGQLEDLSTGIPIVSPGPRRYFQFQIQFFSQDFGAAAGVGGLAFEVLTPPFAEQLIAEIAPRTVALGESTHFTYAVLVLSRPGKDRGFDRLEIDTPLRVTSVGPIRIHRGKQIIQESDFSAADLDNLPVSQNGITIAEVRDDGFVLSFPPIAEDGLVLSVEFENAVLGFGTAFSGRVQEGSANTGIWQEVMAGNAFDLGLLGVDDPDVSPQASLLSGNLSVAVPISSNLLINAAPEPNVFTPNGDGVNDQVSIRYDIANIVGSAPLQIRIFDLAGRPVRQLYAGADPSGRFSRIWDGRDDGGQLVAPGHYLFNIDLDAATGAEREVGLLRLVY